MPTEQCNSNEMCVSEGGNQILNYVRDHIVELGRNGIISNKIQYIVEE